MSELARCRDPRGFCCLMNILDNKCYGLSNTDFGYRRCKFFKDKEEMKYKEVSDYEENIKSKYRFEI